MQIEELQLPGRLVMVKRATNADQLVKLRNESAILSGVFLPGVVRLIESPPPLDVNGIRVSKVGPSLDKFRGLAPLEVAAVISSLARTIAHLQDLQVVHGAIEPAHVLIGPDGRPVLCSFGRTGIALSADVRALGQLTYALLQPQRNTPASDDAEQTRARVVLLEIADSTVHSTDEELPYPDEIADLIDQHIPLRQLPAPDGIPMPRMPDPLAMPEHQDPEPTLLNQTLSGIARFPAPHPPVAPVAPQTPPIITPPPASPRREEPAAYVPPAAPQAPATYAPPAYTPSPFATPAPHDAPQPSPFHEVPAAYNTPQKSTPPQPSPFQQAPATAPSVAPSSAPGANPFGEPEPHQVGQQSAYSALSNMTDDDRFDASWFMDDDAPPPVAAQGRNSFGDRGPDQPPPRMRAPQEVEIPEQRSSIVGTFIFGGAIVAVLGIIVVIFAFVSGGGDDKATPITEVTTATTTPADSSTVPGDSSTSSPTTATTAPASIPPVTTPLGVQQGRCAAAGDGLEVDVDGDGCPEVTKVDTKQIAGSNGSTITVPVLHVFQANTEAATLTMVNATDKFTAGHWGTNVTRTAATFNAGNGCIFAFDTWTDPKQFPPRAIAKLDNHNVVAFESRPTGTGTTDQLLVTYSDGKTQLVKVPALPEAPSAEQCG